MSEIKKISKNSLLSYVARVSDLVSGLATISILSRYLSIEFFGSYMFVMTSGWIFSTIVTMGTEAILCREISRGKENASDFLVNGIFINLLIFILCIMAYSFSVPFLKLNKVIILCLYLNFLSEALKVFMRSIIAVFIAFERMEIDALLTVLSRILALILTIIIVYFKMDFIYLFFTYLIGNSVGLLVGLVILLKNTVISKINIRLRQIRYTFIESFPIP